MGSSGWQIQGSYDADPAKSLRQVQHAFFAEHYNLAERIPQVLADSAQCVAAVQEHDEYGLLDTYSSTLEAVRSIASKPIPTDVDAQIQMLRDVEYATGDPLENILDFKGISTDPSSRNIYPLTDSQLMALFGTTRPTVDMAAGFDSQEAYDMIGRGSAVYFPVFTEPDSGKPTGIMFAGYTVD